jgi:hypothetical protein
VTILDALLTRTSAAIDTPGPAMRRALVTAHTAAYYAGLKERFGFASKGLSKIERAELKTRVVAQLKYYDAFAAQAKDMSDAAVAARAQLYAGAIRATFSEAMFPGLKQYPGDGNTACRTNCLCSLSREDDGIHWNLGAEGCEDCQAMAAGSPYGKDD